MTITSAVAGGGLEGCTCRREPDRHSVQLVILGLEMFATRLLFLLDSIELVKGHGVDVDGIGVINARDAQWVRNGVVFLLGLDALPERLMVDNMVAVSNYQQRYGGRALAELFVVTA